MDHLCFQKLQLLRLRCKLYMLQHAEIKQKGVKALIAVGDFYIICWNISKCDKMTAQINLKLSLAPLTFFSYLSSNSCVWVLPWYLRR